MTLRVRGAAFVFLVAAIYSTVRGEGSIAILPADFTLTGPIHGRRCWLSKLAMGSTSARRAGAQEWTRERSGRRQSRRRRAVAAEERRSDAHAEVGRQDGDCQGSSRKFDEASPVSFRNHVQSVLAKAGCNSGACHGALAGKNGFKLSLRGYDADAD